MKIICLIGEFASGKTELFKRLQHHPNLEGVITTTSRSPRSTEKDGVDYHFISYDTFRTRVWEDKFVEWAEFNGWMYGTTYDAIENNDTNKLIVINPLGFVNLTRKYGEDNVVGIVISRNLRDKAIDYLQRDEKADVYEMCRRIQTDKDDFEWLKRQNMNNTVQIYNETGKFLDCIYEVETLIGGYLL